MRHKDGTFDFDRLDEADFMSCTFNEIRPEDLDAVIETFNNVLEDRRMVESIIFDGCEDVRIKCNDQEFLGDAETTMREFCDLIRG